MSKAYFVPFITLPVMIDQPGNYRTRCGEVVSVDAVSRRHDFNCVGSYATGETEGWHRSGRLFATSHSNNDIVAKA